MNPIHQVFKRYHLETIFCTYKMEGMHRMYPTYRRMDKGYAICPPPIKNDQGIKNHLQNSSISECILTPNLGSLPQII